MSLVMVKQIARGAFASGLRGSTTGSKMTRTDQDQEVRHQHFHDHRIDDGDIRTEPGKSEMARFPGMPVSEESDRPPIVWSPSVNGISQPAVDVVRPFAGRPSRLRRGPR
jgi:hypothetical protein